jgi:5-methyltetrahydropteroyltriglutamate--homocysteine methyltransferase
MAFTATNNVPLAATTTGSWPRPAWYTESLWGRPLDTAMLDPIYREQFGDALALVVSEQERAGLDLVTCGDYFLDADLAGIHCSVGADSPTTNCSRRGLAPNF